MSHHKPGVKVAAEPSTIAGLDDRVYTVAEVARIFEVTEGQVRIWIRSGQLAATRDAGKKSYSVPRESMVNFAIKRYRS